MGNGLWRDFYLKNPGECDRWLKANAVLGSILAIAMLAMALAGLYSAGPNGATEISSGHLELCRFSPRDWLPMRIDSYFRV